MASQFKQLLLGRPLENEQAQHQRLSNPVALAVLSSDALSSVAYATEEILLALVLAGTVAFRLTLPIASAIVALMLIVVFSYRQTIKAYPCGGGAYIVAKDNLGTLPALVAGGSLLVDYVLTVAVSISAGTAAVTSAFPGLLPYTVPIAVGFVAFLTVMNLRGVRESGALFAGPTFFFIVILALLVVSGLFKLATGGVIEVTPHASGAVQTLTLFLVLRAFASGCAAMTGIEAIANGVTLFKQPEATNARRTLVAMAGVLVFLFIGTSLLATLSGVQPSHHETVVSQLGRGTWGGGALYFLLQAATAAILVLAANTSFADFPRLGSFMSGDGFVPKQLKDRGSRLVHSNGMILLAGVSALLLVAFEGSTSRLIPLYAIGVFTSFTLSQSGMVRHWWRLREPGWEWSLTVNAVGAVTTLVVLVVIAVAKFSEGAWVVLIVIPMLVLYFRWVHAHYEDAEERLTLATDQMSRLRRACRSHPQNHVVLLATGIDIRLLTALQFARSMKAAHIEALFVDVTGERGDALRREWEKADLGIKLTVLDSPYRELIDPIRDYVRSIAGRPNTLVTVVLPEIVPASVPDYLLHDQTPFWIKTTLFREPGVIVVDVPYHLRPSKSEEEPDREPQPEMMPALPQW